MQTFRRPALLGQNPGEAVSHLTFLWQGSPWHYKEPRERNLCFPQNSQVTTQGSWGGTRLPLSRYIDRTMMNSGSLWDLHWEFKSSLEPRGMQHEEPMAFLCFSICTFHAVWWAARWKRPTSRLCDCAILSNIMCQKHSKISDTCSILWYLVAGFATALANTSYWYQCRKLAHRWHFQLHETQWTSRSYH